MKNKNINEYIDYNKINDMILKESENNPSNNYIYYFTSEDNKDTSITIEFERPSKNSFYGISPAISTDDIFDELLKADSYFSSKDSIYDFANSIENEDMWSVPTEEKTKDLDQDFFVKCLLSMAQFFYIDLDLESIDHPKHFLNILDSENNNNSDYRFSFYDILDDQDLNYTKQKSINKIRVYGRLPNIILSKLDQADYRYVVVSGHLKIVCNQKGQTFNTLYLEKAFRHLECTSEFFYNGVNLRLKNVVVSKHSSANNSNQELKLIVERTTFGTICGFDGRSLGLSTHQENNVIGHPYLNSAREKLVRIVKDEAALVNNFVSQLKTQKLSPYPSIQLLKKYLEQSIYPHYINISGNLVTSEGYCIYTKRDNSVTDSGSLYCSVNGVTEVMDPLVKHYLKPGSDKPTLEFRKGTQTQNFDNELDRETLCELGITNTSSAWVYYGFSLMGRIDGNKVDTSHINILATKTIDTTFDKLKKSWLKATERKENQQLYGNKVQVHFGWLSTFFAYFGVFTDVTYEIKDIIVLVAYIGLRVIFVLTSKLDISQLFLEFTHIPATSFLDSVFAVLAIIRSAKYIKDLIKNKKDRETARLRISPHRNLKAYLKGIFGNKYEHSHPIVQLMMILHLKDKIEQKKSAVD